jgi:4-diphosphocytidyl-2-C-methyl-D-erythritol kinase
MDSVSIEAPAKLNLRLLVGPVRPDGYHPIRSLMVALAGLSDTVTIAPASSRVVDCAGLDGPANLAWQALDVLEREVGHPLPCLVQITKRIPQQAGLGGGSSDAAAVLVGANRMFGLGLAESQLEQIGSQVGSDVPFFVRGGAQWAEGRGERLSPAAIPDFAAVILAPEPGLSTAAVYSAFDALPKPPDNDQVGVPAGMPELAGWVRNDLWAAAISLQPELAAVSEDLCAHGAATTLLCGSGSAVAGLFDTAARADAAARSLTGRVFRVGPAQG